jgi:hypothetical protein
MEARKQAAIVAGQRAAKSTPLVMLIYMVVLAGMVVAFVMTGSFQYVQNALGQWAVPTVAAIGAILLIFLATIPMRWRRSTAQFSQAVATMPVDYPVYAVEGNVKLKSRSGGGSIDGSSYFTFYYVNVGGKEFQVSVGRYKALKKAIERGGHYRLYYAENGRSAFLLSAEPTGR